MKTLLLALACWWSSAVAVRAEEDLLVADFEGADYGAWVVAGEAFGKAPARGTLPNQMAVEGFLGQGLVNSFVGGDGATGTLTSPPLRLERRFLRFLIGGGGYAGETCMNLLLDGQIVRTATGPNTRPGGSERLDWQEWEVSDWRGRSGVLEIVDRRTGGWGHINVDHILQTDQPLPRILTNVTREITIRQRYLNLPVKRGTPKRWVRIRVGDELDREFEIELADGAADWWAFADVTRLRGQRVRLEVDRLREDSRALSGIEQSDEIQGAADLYRERLRPQFHFTSQRGWNNDPNGLVYHRGEYHLFYQHNPYGWDWGNMHWGHAVSADLVHWQELGEALEPDDLGTMFSGSAVVDELNTTGFGREGEPALVCIYTAAGGTHPRSRGEPFTQCLAYSTDRGRTWTTYAGNPVLPHIVGSNRDPKVIWYAPEHKWVMALYLDDSDFALFDSRDLKRWEKMSTVRIPGTSECPEFFELPVEDNAGETRWIFYGGNGRYLVGRFDGRHFTTESGPHPLNFGNCFYASQTFNQLPSEDGRRILIGWGQVSFPGMPFNQMMDFPVTLTLRRTADGLRLFTNPVREIEKLWDATTQRQDVEVRAGENPLSGLAGELLDVDAEIVLGDAREVGLRVRGVRIAYDVERQELTCLGKRAALAPVEGRIQLRLLVDRGSIEIFANRGRLYMPMGILLDDGERSVEAFAAGGTARLASLEARTLRTIW